MTDRLLLYDTHCHLQSSDFDHDREAVIERALSAGVRRALLVAEDLEDCFRVLEISERHPDFLVPAFGVHPDRAPMVSDAEVAEVLRQIEAHQARLGAIGEVGLDHRPRWSEAERSRQREVFVEMIRLSNRTGLTLSVHSRNAGRAAVSVLKSESSRSAVLHAFDGRPVYAEEGAKAGFAFSAPPSITTSEPRQRTFLRLPIESILLESDSPVLGPVPKVRNEPRNLGLTIEVLAKLRGIPQEDLAEAFRRNTHRCLPKLVEP